MKELLEEVLKAWDSIEGGRLYTPLQISDWLAQDMAPAISKIRKHLEKEKTMDTLSAWAKGVAARAAGNKLMVFDWDEAARLLKQMDAQNAEVGLESDWDWTAGNIFKDGKPILPAEWSPYCASIWATPQIRIDGYVIDCWKWAEDTDGWNAQTYWPDSALEIFNG